MWLPISQNSKIQTYNTYILNGNHNIKKLAHGFVRNIFIHHLRKYGEHATFHF